MELVINISKKIYERIKYLEPNRNSNNLLDVLMCSIQDGTPIKEYCDSCMFYREESEE